MVEALLLRLKEHSGLEGRITAELLDEGDCVGEAWGRVVPSSAGGSSLDAGAGRGPHGRCDMSRPALRRRHSRPVPVAPSLQARGRASAWPRCSSQPPTRCQTFAASTMRSGAGRCTSWNPASTICKPVKRSRWTRMLGTRPAERRPGLACFTRAPARLLPLACSGKRLTLVVNPQWQTQGQVISGGCQARRRHMAVRCGVLLTALACPLLVECVPHPRLPLLPCDRRLWHWPGAQGCRALCRGL